MWAIKSMLDDYSEACRAEIKWKGELAIADKGLQYSVMIYELPNQRNAA